MKIPTKRQYEMSKAVLDGMKIHAAAEAFGVSKTTIRRALDAVTEFGCAKISMELSGDDWKQIIGWLRNGNTSAGFLADRVEANIEGRETRLKLKGGINWEARA